MNLRERTDGLARFFKEQDTYEVWVNAQRVLTHRCPNYVRGWVDSHNSRIANSKPRF